MKESNQFVLVYDKLTKPVAKYLFNELAGTYSCVLWSKKDYLGNEAKIKNTNKVLFFDESLIKENLVNASKKVELNGSVFLELQGSVAGMYVNPDLDLNPHKDVLKENWLKMILGLVASRLIGGFLLYWFLSLKKKKRVRLTMLLDTVKEFKSSQALKDFMNGTTD